MKTESIEGIACLCCLEGAVIKSYRTHQGITEGYPVCLKHHHMDDRNFWKALGKKERFMLREGL